MPRFAQLHTPVIFADIKFTHMAPRFPWAEASIERIAFRDCAARAGISEIGSHYENDYVSDTVTVKALYEIQGELVDEHAGAFDYFVQNLASYEARALAYLHQIAKSVVQEALISHASHGMDRFSEGLPKFIEKYDLDKAEGIRNLISWEGLTVFDHGFLGRGVITLDFNCGWDEEHGVSLLMHDARLIAAGARADFSNRGDAMLDHAKYLQRICPGHYDILL